MAKEWTEAELETFANNYIINENSTNRVPFKLNSTETSTESTSQIWREFRRRLFEQVRFHVKDCVSRHKEPGDALKLVRPSMSTLANRYNLFKLAVQVEASKYSGAVCSWAVQELLEQLALVAHDQCKKTRLAPRALTALHLAPALAAMRRSGASVRCTRTHLVDVWQRLCSLRTWQLYRLARAGDKQHALPPVEQLAARDWRLLDALLLWDADERMRVVTAVSLESAESYLSLVVLVTLLAMVPGGFRRVSRYNWSQLIARYRHTLRTASVILLQRRWYHLRRMAQSALEGDAPPNPLLQFIAMQFGQVMKERKRSWGEIVSLGNYVMEEDDVICKRESRKKRWYFEVKRLESLKTVDEINEYLTKRLHRNEEKSKFVFKEKNMPINSEIVVVDDDSNETNDDTLTVNNTSEAAKHDNNSNQIDENRSDTVNVNSTSQVPTIEALQRIDPNAATVTVVFESDSDEDASGLFNDKIKMEEHGVSQGSETSKDSKKETEDVNMYDVSEDAKIDINDDKGIEEDIHGIKDESEELKTYNNNKLRKVEDQTHCSLHMLGKHADSDFISIEKKEAETNVTEVNDEGNSNEKRCNLNETTYIKREDDVDENITIDNKLLYTTHVKLTRIDETSAWIRHAANNTIDVRRAGFLESYEDDNELLRPVRHAEVDDDTTSDDDCTYDSFSDVDSTISYDWHDLKPELRGVSKRVLSNARNQKFLNLCKPAVLRLRRLDESEIPRRGRVVKRVELADIDEVRRINRNILTAQVKPISLGDNKEDELQEDKEEGSSERKFMKLETELLVLERDMRFLFKLPYKDLQALIDKAVNSDEIQPVTDTTESDVTNVSNLFLEHDEEDLDSAKDINTDIDDNVEPVKKLKKNKRNINRTEKNKITEMPNKDAKDINTDIDDNVEPVKKLKKNKRKINRTEKNKITEMPNKDAPVWDAYQEWERQKHIANIYFEFGKTANKLRGNKRKIDDIDSTSEAGGKRIENHNTKRKIEDIESPSKTGGERIETDNTKRKIEDIQSRSKAGGERIENDNTNTEFDDLAKEEVVYRKIAPQLPMIEVVKEINRNIDNISNSYLTKLLNLPAKEPNVDTLRYMLLSPMEAPDQVVEINVVPEKNNDAVEENDEYMEVTPVITAVCSLADTQVIDDEADENKVEETEESPTPSTTWSIQSAGNPQTSNGDPTLTIIPMRSNIVIGAGGRLGGNTLEMKHSVRRAESTAPGAIKRKNENEPSTPNQPLLEKYLVRAPPAETSPPLKLTLYKPLDADDSTRPLSAAQWLKNNRRNISREKQELYKNIRRIAKRRNASKPAAKTHTQPDDTHRQPTIDVDVEEGGANGYSGAPTETSGPQSENKVESHEQLDLEAKASLPAVVNDYAGFKKVVKVITMRNANVGPTSVGLQRQFVARQPVTTTPCKYIQTDRRKLLTVVKLNMWRPPGAINQKYCIVTEKNLSCSHPGYWTVDRNPPGPCQFLMWPTDAPEDNEIAEEVNDKSRVYNTDSVSNEEQYLNSDSKHHVQNIDGNVKCKSGNDFSECREVNELISNETRDFDELVGNKSEKDEGIYKNIDGTDEKNDLVLEKRNESEVKTESLGVTSNFYNRPHNQLLDNYDSDSDSEDNKLQIVENETEPNEFPDASVARLDTNSTDISEMDKDIDNANNKTEEKSLADHGYAKSDKDSARMGSSMIKVKSFASVNRMEAKSVTLDAKGKPDIIEKDNRFYKKLLDVPVSPGSDACIPTYALMLSAVSDIEECDRLLRAGEPLQVFEWQRGHLEPLVATRGAGHRLRLAHSDPAFLDDLVVKLRRFCGDPEMYTASAEKRGPCIRKY